MEQTINLNTAKPDDLTTLPGVGTAMAKRIIAARPYDSIEALQQVSGVGPALFERLAPLVSLVDLEDEEEIIYLEATTDTPPAETEEILEAVDTPTEESLPEAAQPEEQEDEEPEAEPIPRDKAIIPVNEPEEKTSKPTEGPKPVTWGRVLLLSTAFSLGAFVFAVLLTLGIIGTINNGLRYASPSDLHFMSGQLDSLDSQIGVVLDDIENLRTRLDNLEAMSAQVGELQAATEQLSADMAITVDLVSGMETQIDELESRTVGFQAFLDGLAELLTSLTEPVQEDVPQEAP
jgi:hypothetical protein